MILIPAVFCPRPWGSHVRYAYARSLKFYDTTLLWQWMRMPGDVPGHVSACCIGVPDASVLGAAVRVRDLELFSMHSR
jgi:hypothetical protein